MTNNVSLGRVQLRKQGHRYLLLQLWGKVSGRAGVCLRFLGPRSVNAKSSKPTAPWASVQFIRLPDHCKNAEVTAVYYLIKLSPGFQGLNLVHQVCVDNLSTLHNVQILQSSRLDPPFILILWTSNQIPSLPEPSLSALIDSLAHGRAMSDSHWMVLANGPQTLRFLLTKLISCHFSFMKDQSPTPETPKRKQNTNNINKSQQCFFPNQFMPVVFSI